VAAAGTDNNPARRIPWLYSDLSNAKFDPRTDPDGYAKHVAERFKEKLKVLQKEGKLDQDGDEGLYVV